MRAQRKSVRRFGPWAVSLPARTKPYWQASRLTVSSDGAGRGTGGNHEVVRTPGEHNGSRRIAVAVPAALCPGRDGGPCRCRHRGGRIERRVYAARRPGIGRCCSRTRQWRKRRIGRPGQSPPPGPASPTPERGLRRLRGIGRLGGRRLALTASPPCLDGRAPHCGPGRSRLQRCCPGRTLLEQRFPPLRTGPVRFACHSIGVSRDDVHRTRCLGNLGSGSRRLRTEHRGPARRRGHSDPQRPPAHRAAGSLSVVTAGVENEKQASPVDG